NCVADGQGMKITDEMLNKSVWIKLKTEADGKEFKIPKKDDAPNVTATNASAKDKKDGTLTVTNPGSAVYEYHITGGAWAGMTAGKATGLAAGSYEVRKKATDTAFASEIAVANVNGSYVKNIAFSDRYYKYTDNAPNTNDPVELGINVSNFGVDDVVVTNISLNGLGKDAFEIANPTPNTTVKGGKEGVVSTVKFKPGLNAGNYKASVVVTYANGKTNSAEISFTVRALKVTPSIDSVESKTYDKSKNAKGKLKLTPPNGYSFGNDEPTATGKFVFDSADAGTKKAVSVSDIKLGSGFDKNYVLSSTSIKNKTTSAKINKAKNTKKPEDVKVSSFTYNSITMKTASGVEYSIDDGDNWTSTGSFKSLKEKTSYTILARFKESTNYEASKSVSVEQTTLRNPIISNPQNNKVTGVQTTTSYKTGSTLTFTATGAGSEIKSPSQSPSLDDVRYIPVSWTSYVNGTWDNNASSNSGSFKLNSSGSYTLSVSFQKQKYDGTNWVNETSTKDTKSVSYKVVTSTTTSSTNKNTTNKTGVKTGDVNPIMLMVILLVVSGAVIVVLVVRTRSKRRQHRE
ncbi:YDG domain-containing protein, partial [Robinsoniella sp. RHS]|uniref:YDG domain-containing protein n=1 Tax=Robinsoniella sp. RHS TaxID=1504536 RepID=UPI000649B03A